MTDLFGFTPPPPRKTGAMGAHQSSAPGTVTWLTPPGIIEALGGPDSFDLDPCTISAPPWPTARRHVSLPHDGLAIEWEGRVWCNPPYSDGEIVKWLRKLAMHDQGTALIFARTETEAFQRHVWGAASGLLFFRGRLTFHYPDGRPGKGNAGAPSVLCAYGQDDLDRLAASGLDGALVPLRFTRFALVSALGGTWTQVVLEHVRRARGPVCLGDIYRSIAHHPKAKTNPNWQAKVRQVLQLGPFTNLERGVWAAQEQLWPPAST